MYLIAGCEKMWSAASHAAYSPSGTSRSPPPVLAQLVFDLGFNNGDDTALLLRHGFRVVAVEADPALLRQGRQRFHAEIHEGRLSLVQMAIATSREQIGTTIPFWVGSYSPWSSFKVTNKACRGSTANCRQHDVRAAPCSELRAAYGAPYMLKIDVNGDALPCLEDMTSHREVPSYIAVEVAPAKIGRILQHLHAKGYDAFKVVPQKPTHDVWGLSSGPMGEFGRDCRLAYRWRSFESARRIFSSWNTTRNTTTRTVHGSDDAKNSDCTIGWRDLHARHRSLRGGIAPVAPTLTQID